MDNYLVNPAQSVKSSDTVRLMNTFTTTPTVPGEVNTTSNTTSVMTCYSVILCSAASTKSSTTTTSSESSSSTVDMSIICKGCNNPFHRCMERRWHKIYLHSVIDYFEEVGYNCITEASVKEKYCNTFEVKIKSKIMEQSSGFYEIEENVLIPEFMTKGFLKEMVSIQWVKITKLTII